MYISMDVIEFKLPFYLYNDNPNTLINGICIETGSRFHRGQIHACIKCPFMKMSCQPQVVKHTHRVIQFNYQSGLLDYIRTVYSFKKLVAEEQFLQVPIVNWHP